MYKLFFITLISFLIASCDAVDDMKGMFEKQSLAHDYIKEHYGWESQLGFNMINGALVQVTLVLNASEIRDKTVPELEAVVKEVAAEVFKSKPQALYIQILADGE